VQSKAGKLAIEQAQAFIAGEGILPYDESALLPLIPIALFYHEDLALLERQSLDPQSLRIAEAIATALQSKSPPSDFRHTLLHAAQTPSAHCALLDSALLDSAIAGAISGAAHSITGIPPSWRKRLAKAGYAPFWGFTEAELLQTADHLLAAWAGVYHPTQGRVLPIAAAPRTWN
jgi:ADP-ribosylglycohydrolase